MSGIVMSVILIVCMALIGFLVLQILTDTRETALREFVIMGLFSALVMVISYFVELNAADFSAKVTAVKFGYIGRVFVNPMLLMLVMRYYGTKLAKLWQILLYLIPTVTLIAVFQCDTTRYYYSSMWLSAEGQLLVTPGPLYFGYMAYNTVLALIYISYCLIRRAELTGRDKHNNSLLIGACLIPFATLLTYLAGVSKGYDISCVGVTLGCSLVALSVLHYGLLNKEEILSNMATGLIFLDSDYHLVYANQAAQKMLPAVASQPVTSHKVDLKQLCEPQFSAIRVGDAAYQRRITEWSSADGRNGKLLTFDDITEIRARLNRDGMTGLLNHASFYPALDDAMAQHLQTGDPLTVSIADIDSFKRINDTYGHANGDIILIALADTLNSICSVQGDVFRYGGEEFAVIFDCGTALAEQIMQTALEQFSARTFDFMEGHVTFSYGSAEFQPADTSVALFDRADQLMYTRKKALHARERAAAEAMHS